MIFVPSTVIQPTRNVLIIPAFSYPQTWTGVSELLYRYPVSNTVPISIKLPVPEESAYVLGASYTEGGHTYRWRFWDAGVLWYPVYNGERLGAGSYLEVWSVYGVDPAVAAADIELEYSQLTEPTVGLGQCYTNTNTETTLTAEYVGETSPPMS